MASFVVTVDRGRNVAPVPNGGTIDENDAPRATLTLTRPLGTGETLTLTLDGNVLRTLTRGTSIDVASRGLDEGVHRYGAQVRDATGAVRTLDLNAGAPGTDFTFRVDD